VTAGAPALRPGNRPLYAGIAVLLAASVGLQVVRDRGWQAYEPPAALLWMRSPALMRKLALGFDPLLADLYWMRAVVYFGGERRKSTDSTYELLYPLLELTTRLDPRFKVAYRFGAIFLSEGYPGGPGLPEKAIELLQRGLEVDPARWEYAHDIGFVHYWALSDYRTAADWFLKASRIPDAPNWLAPLAATTLAGGGDRASSRRLWTELRDTADQDWIKRNADHRLAQLDAMDQMDRLNAQLEEAARRLGHAPTSWEELARAGMLRQVPRDPRGTPYALDADTGRVTLARESPLQPLPGEVYR
jgi:tetratricopeptide (TPR) repeat protein